MCILVISMPEENLINVVGYIGLQNKNKLKVSISVLRSILRFKILTLIWRVLIVVDLFPLTLEIPEKIRLCVLNEFVAEIATKRSDKFQRNFVTGFSAQNLGRDPW